MSDMICLEHQLSVIEIKPYRERQKRITYPPRESNRDRLCGIIDEILQQEPTDYEEFLQKLEQQGYEIKRGKYTSVKGARQKRFIRFKTLGAGYSEEEIKAVLAGRAKHHPHQKQPPKEQTFQLLVDILPPEHKARWLAGAALTAADQAMASVMSTVLSRLNAFLDTELEQVICYDSPINAEMFAAEKCAFFSFCRKKTPPRTSSRAL